MTEVASPSPTSYAPNFLERSVLAFDTVEPTYGIAPSAALAGLAGLVAGGVMYAEADMQVYHPNPIRQTDLAQIKALSDAEQHLKAAEASLYQPNFEDIGLIVTIDARIKGYDAQIKQIKSSTPPAQHVSFFGHAEMAGSFILPGVLVAAGVYTAIHRQAQKVRFKTGQAPRHLRKKRPPSHA